MFSTRAETRIHQTGAIILSILIILRYRTTDGFSAGRYLGTRPSMSPIVAILEQYYTQSSTVVVFERHQLESDGRYEDERRERAEPFADARSQAISQVQLLVFVTEAEADGKLKARPSEGSA